MRPSRSAAELLVGSASAPNLHRPPSASSSQGGGRGADLRRSVRAKTAFDLKLGGLVQHEFGHALGEHGLQWDDTIVTGVKGVAKQKGIRLGWKIYMVDGKCVNNSQEIWGCFQEAKWQWRNCHVWFVTDLVAIRADAAKARAAKIQAETERLARLPFEGAHDTRHLEQLKEEFVFQGFVDGPENRAVTAGQLRRVLNWSANHCHRWRDPKTRVKLHLDFMNMYQLCHWLIMPATAGKDCSVYEMMTKEKQTPSWYVVQSWGEKVANLLLILEAHTRFHGGSNQNFWIGAFANRQHSLGDWLADGHESSPFYKAMAAANFHILLYLDPKMDLSGPATTLSRLWCDFELSMCVESGKAVLDISTIQQDKVLFLNKGLTAEEKDMEKAAPGSGYKAKELRERPFSVATIDKALSVSIQKAEVSDPADRRRIMNYIAGRDPNSIPLEECDAYIKVNKRLRALFAHTCWRRVISITGDENMKDLQFKLTDAIRNDSWQEILDISLAYMTAPAEKMMLLMRSLPSGLRELSLNLVGIALGDENVVALANAAPLSLEEVFLDLTGNVDVSNVGVANYTGNLPPKVRKSCLELKATGVSKEFQEKSDTLDGIKQAIYDESQKGNLCTTVNLLPIKEVKGRMAYQLERSKCY